ncbi:MAG: acyl-CoA thioesterase [Pseudomonadota bacterium]
MYPYLRMVKELAWHRRSPRLALGQVHRSHHICWPWDIDVFGELNNGRTLTLFDLGRFGLFQRIGFLAAGRQRGWIGAVAGVSVRYKRRIRIFNRLEMRSRFAGWDARFAYCEQSLWHGETCCSHALVRLVVTGRDGIVPPSEIADALGYQRESPSLPDWIASWAAAEAKRPWPPMS